MVRFGRPVPPTYNVITLKINSTIILLHGSSGDGDLPSRVARLPPLYKYLSTPYSTQMADHGNVRLKLWSAFGDCAPENHGRQDATEGERHMAIRDRLQPEPWSDIAHPFLSRLIEPGPNGSSREDAFQNCDVYDRSVPGYVFCMSSIASLSLSLKFRDGRSWEQDKMLVPSECVHIVDPLRFCLDLDREVRRSVSVDGPTIAEAVAYRDRFANEGESIPSCHPIVQKPWLYQDEAEVRLFWPIRRKDVKRDSSLDMCVPTLSSCVRILVPMELVQRSRDSCRGMAWNDDFSCLDGSSKR